MNPLKISDFIQIQRRFLRSAHLERDFRDPSAAGWPAGRVDCIFAKADQPM